MRLAPWLAFLHKWLGLIIGVQIILWLTGGLVMTAFPIEMVHGDHNVRETEPTPITAAALDASLPDIVATHAPQGVMGVTLKHILGRTVYDVQREDGTRILVDTHSGGLVDINETIVRALADADFSGSGQITEIGIIEQTNSEYRGPVPVWRVRFNDPEDTRLYVTADTGRIIARRNATWRLFDFFWMLHIMDYKDRTDFNNPLVITAAAFGLFTALMGFGLLFYRLRFRDWRVIFAKRR